MKRKYLGDSYDVVKRLWRELFEPWAPLFAEGKFIPSELQDDFTRLTGIRILRPNVEGPYCIFNDPDTGVRAPHSRNQSEGKSHISLTTIAKQCVYPGVKCVITYDQSSHRTAGLGANEQRAAKVRYLSHQNVLAFYYVSHAPFLFASSSSDALKTAVELIHNAGIPASRLEGVW